MQFKYQAENAEGVLKEGVLDTSDKFELAKELKKTGLTVISAKATKSGGVSFLTRLNESVITVKLKDKIFFASNLAEMISAGLSLSRSLNVLGRQSSNERLKRTIDDIQAEIDKGQSFSSALGKYPKIFSPVFVAMVEAGEKSGKLPESLRVISDQFSKTFALRKKIKGALMYPMIIIIAMILVGAAMLIYVVPTLAETFEEVGAELPVTTRSIIWVSNFLQHNIIWSILIVALAVFALSRFLKTAIGKRVLATILLKFPLTSKLTMQVNAAVTARTLSALVSSGVDLLESLEITRNVLTNPFYKKVLVEAQEKVPKGVPMSEIFKENEKLYPPFVGEMVLVGEETGKNSEMLLKLAVYYEGEVDSATKNLSTIIEPVIMILVGVGVGFFALSMIQPIYSIGTAIK